MLFEDPDGTSTEDFVNPKITKVEMTIEGVPNQLYSQGMRQYQQWDEIKKYFALTSKRDKETDKVAVTHKAVRPGARPHVPPVMAEG